MTDTTPTTEPDRRGAWRRTADRQTAAEARIAALEAKVKRLAALVEQGGPPPAPPMAAAFIVAPEQENTRGSGVIEPVYAHTRSGQPLPSDDAPPRGRMTITGT